MSRVVVVALAGLALGVACDAPPWETSSTSRTAVALPVERADLRVEVTAHGELESVNASPVAVPQVPTGALKVKEIVDEGSIVEEGEVVVRFDDSQLEIDLENHESTSRSTRRRMDRNLIQAAIEAGSIGVMKGVAVLERDHAEEFVIDDEMIYSRLEILENELMRDEAGETIVFADASLELRGEYYDIEEKILEVQRQQVEGNIGRVKTSLGNLVLRAPIGGMVVYKKNWRGSTVAVGDSLWPGNVIMSIVDPAQTAMKVWVLEKDATGVAEGAEAVVRVDASAEREFRGKVESVAKLSRPIERGSPVKYFEAKVAIEDGDPALLKPGMKGEVRITTTRVEDAVVIPRSALRGSEGVFHVLVETEEGSESRAVVPGPGDRVRVSIAKGLTPGERVLLGGEASSADQEQPADGAPVAAAAGL